MPQQGAEFTVQFGGEPAGATVGDIAARINSSKVCSKADVIWADWEIYPERGEHSPANVVPDRIVAKES